MTYNPPAACQCAPSHRPRRVTYSTYSSISLTVMSTITPSTNEEGPTTLLEVLPPELVVGIASHLDLASILALASSSPSLTSLLTSAPEWRRVVARLSHYDRDQDRTLAKGATSIQGIIRLHNQMNHREMEVKAAIEVELGLLSTFLKTVPDPVPLVEEVLHLLVARFPPKTPSNMVSLSCPLASHPTHHTSSAGLHLLHLTTTSMGGIPWVLEVAKLGLQVNLQASRDQGSLQAKEAPLASLAAWLALQQDHLANVQVDSVRCRTGQDFRQLTGLLQAAGRWEVGSMDLMAGEGDEQVEEMARVWTKLAKAMGKGKVRKVVTTKETLGVGRKEDLEVVWRGTEVDWMVMESEWLVDKVIVRRDREEEGWQEVVVDTYRQEVAVVKEERKRKREMENDSPEKRRRA